MKKTSKKAKKQTGNRRVWTRRGVILIATLAVLILVVNVISLSFSWPTPQEGKKTGYSGAYTFRSEHCTMSTHVGEMYVYEAGVTTDHFTGYIVYEHDPHSLSEPVSISAGETAYFRTKVQNSSTVLYPSNVSLYIANFPAKASLGVTDPSNTFRTYDAAQTDLHIVRNAYVKVYVSTDVNGPGVLNIDWFVVNNGTSAISIDLDDLYLVYN